MGTKFGKWTTTTNGSVKDNPQHLTCKFWIPIDPWEGISLYVGLLWLVQCCTIVWGQLDYPTLVCCIQSRSCQDVHQGVIIWLDHELVAKQMFMKHHQDSPLQSQKFQFVHWVVALSFVQGMAYHTWSYILYHQWPGIGLPLGQSHWHWCGGQRAVYSPWMPKRSGTVKVFDFFKGLLAPTGPLHQLVFLTCIVPKTSSYNGCTIEAYPFKNWW